MDKSISYFYDFLESFSIELADVARELEMSIYTSPRTMLTHSRTFADTLLQKVMINENIIDVPYDSFKERLDKLAERGLLTTEILDSLHTIRKKGNQAAHQTRSFRFSDSLLTWEALYSVVKWYIEVYGSPDFKVPNYRDPIPSSEEKYDMAELEVRLKSLEELLKLAMNKEHDSSGEVAASTSEEVNEFTKDEPGFTTIRNINFGEQSLNIPYFLRDAFLLPQRFSQCTTFLIRLSAEQQARIMSELPENLEGLHKHVNRFNELNDKKFFDELKVFINEEKARRRIIIERPDELFLFYKDQYVVLTNELAQIELTSDNFSSIPSLIKQLKRDNIKTVGQLPKELVVLGKYDNVGVGTVEKMFDMLVQKQILINNSKFN